MRIPYDQLVLSAKLGAGSQGVIYRAQPDPAFGLTFALIYKEFSEKTVVAGLSLELLARFRADLDEQSRRVIDLRTVWPAAVVEKAGRVCGYVMQEIPAPFMQTIRTTTGSEPIAREVQHLFVADALARKNIGEVPKRTERFALAREAAFIFGFLHKREMIFGDFSYKNAVYALRPQPMVMLLDCDAVRRRGQGSAVPQLNSPGWGAPEKGPQTIESDRYKLGLFILRCLTPGVNAQNRDPDKAASVLDAQGLDLLRRALGEDPAPRPSGKTWVEYLDAHIAASGGVRARTQPAALPAAPPVVAKVRRAGGVRRVAPVAGPARSTATGRRAATVAGLASAASPQRVTRNWPPPAGGFGSPPGTRRPRPASKLYNRNGPLGLPQLSAPGFLLFLLVAAGVFVLVGLISGLSGSSKHPTTVTLATLPTTTVVAGSSPPTTAALWPTDARPLAQSAIAAVAEVTATAGKGWEVASLHSVAEMAPARGLAQSAWFVDVRGPSTPDAPTTVAWRTYKADAAGTVTLVEDTVRPVPASGAAPTMAALWPVALEAALNVVATPARQSGPILVRYDCTTNDAPVGAWELRFLKSAATPTEVDRVYVADNGQRTIAAPPWATPR